MSMDIKIIYRAMSISQTCIPHAKFVAVGFPDHDSIFIFEEAHYCRVVWRLKVYMERNERD